MIQPIKGTVQGDAVRLERRDILIEGQRVIVIALPPGADTRPIPPEIEAEDVAFVRRTRGRLARQLGAAETDPDA